MQNKVLKVCQLLRHSKKNHMIGCESTKLLSPIKSETRINASMLREGSRAEHKNLQFNQLKSSNMQNSIYANSRYPLLDGCLP